MCLLATFYNKFLSQYLDLQEHFQEIHKELTELKAQSHGTNEIKSDIKTMEEEKENLSRVLFNTFP